MFANATKSTRFALAAAIALLGSLTMLTPAGAGDSDFSVNTTPLFVVAQATFSFEIPTDNCDANTVVTVDGVPGATIDLTDPNNGTITFPAGTLGGNYPFTVTCEDGKGGSIGGSGQLLFATINIDKAVTGAVPADTQFAISVDCTNFVRAAAGDGFGESTSEGLGTPLQADLTYGADGGSEYLVAYFAQDCTVSETDDGGAASSSIEVEDCGTAMTPGGEAAGPSGDFSLPEPTDCTQTITNNFPEPAPVPAAAPADIVQTQPAFTG